MSVITWRKQLSYYLIFLFLFFSLITKVEHGKISCDKSQSHRMSHHKVIVTWRLWEIKKHSHIVIVYSIVNPTGTLLSSLCQMLIKEQLALFWLRSWLTDNVAARFICLTSTISIHEEREQVNDRVCNKTDLDGKNSHSNASHVTLMGDGKRKKPS